MTGLMISCQSDMQFDSQKWKNGGGEDITLDIRANMVNDLIKSEILIGKTDSEIVGLLGNSEKLHNRDESNVKYYPVQEKYGWGDIDPKEMTFLEIHFTNQGISDSLKLIITK